MRNAFAAAAAIMVFGVSVANAEVLVNDTFSRNVVPGSWGTTPGGIDYLLGNPTQTPFVDGSVGNFGAGSALTLSANLAPLAPVGYTVSFTANRNISTGGFVSFFTGVSDGVTGAPLFGITNSDADYGVRVQQNNAAAGELIARIFTNGTEATSFALPGSDNSAAFDVFFEVLAPSGYDNGDTGTITLSVNGSLLGSETITFDGVNSGFATVASNIAGDNVTLDNLRVVAVPEPASSLLGLLGLGLFGCYRRRTA